jgi:hypothetical protein
MRKAITEEEFVKGLCGASINAFGVYLGMSRYAKRYNGEESRLRDCRSFIFDEVKVIEKCNDDDAYFNCNSHKYTSNPREVEGCLLISNYNGDPEIESRIDLSCSPYFRDNRNDHASYAVEKTSVGNIYIEIVSIGGSINCIECREEYYYLIRKG